MDCAVSIYTIPSVAPASEVPRDWQHHKYSAELHVQRHVNSHPWLLASSPADADLIVVATNLSLWCAAGRPFGARRLLRRVLDDPLVRDASQPKALVLTNTECAHVVLQGVALPRHVLLITDRPERPALVASGASAGAGSKTRTRRVVAPAVVARPAWLLSDDGKDDDHDDDDPSAPQASHSASLSRLVVPSWGERRLAFFAGHVPRLFLSPLRYLIWKQLRNVAGVTALSHSLDCAVAAFAPTCAQPRKRQMAARDRQCNATTSAGSSSGGTYSSGSSGSSSHGSSSSAARGPRHRIAAAPTAPRGSPREEQCRCRFVSPCRLGSLCSAPKPHGLCDAYRQVDFAAELPDVARDTRCGPLCAGDTAHVWPLWPIGGSKRPTPEACGAALWAF